MQFTDKFPSAHQKSPVGDLGSYGMETLAYVKPVIMDGQKLHSIHAADGTPLTVISERDLAFATVRQYDLEPASVH